MTRKSSSRNPIGHIGFGVLFLCFVSCAEALPWDNNPDAGLDTDKGTEFPDDLDTSSGILNDTETDSKIDVDTESDTPSDSESDTEPDTETDQCPDDEDKTEPGLCGCGVAEGTCVIPCADGNGRLDPATKLCWQNPGAEDPLTWQDAIDYCAGLSLGGISAWRLPLLIDFVDLLGNCEDNLIANLDGYCNTCANSPTCNELFPSDLEAYWAHRSGVEGTSWVVRFFTGRLKAIDNTKTRYVRCVWP